MSFRGGGDAGGRAAKNAGPEYIRNIPKFLQKYEHLLEKREGQKVVRGDGGDGAAPGGRGATGNDEFGDDTFEDQIEGATIVHDERDAPGAPAVSGPAPGVEAQPEWERLKDEGNAAFGQGKHKEAVALFTKALELEPRKSALYSNRSAANAAMQQYEAALADGKKALQVQPGWGKAHSRIGAALFGLKRYEEAVEAYRRAVKAEPKTSTYKEALEQAEKKAREVEEKEAESGRHTFRKRKQTGRDSNQQQKKSEEDGKVSKKGSSGQKLSFSED